jgi:hypothetical protein
MRRFLPRIWLWLWLCVGLRSLSADPGIIYFVLGSDTAIWNAPGGIDINVHTNHFSPDLYTNVLGRGYQAMDPAYRNSFSDSFGNPLKLTWWMLVGSVYGSSDNNDEPIPNLMPLYFMKKFHGDRIKQFGDELTLHYHTFLWSDYDGGGTNYWNQAKTFHECRADFDKAVAQSLIEEEVFTVTFRSGWHYMDDEWQSYINQLWPYNMDNDSPTKSGESRQPFFNVLDWSEATLQFVPFHPATTNYQVAGDGKGWNVRSAKTPNVTQATLDRIFSDAAGGTNQVVSFWTHLPESYFLTDMTRMDQLIHNSASNNPAVQFRYCTAIEAMQRWLGTSDTNPPVLTVAQDVSGDAVTLRLTTDKPIYQVEPYVAIKDISENYRIVHCTATGSNSWSATLPAPLSSLAKAGIAVTDLAGNLTTRIIRFVPDDVFIDNLDPQYAETAGKWTSTANSAWGVDARIATLKPDDTATAQWALTVAERRDYVIYIQTPPVTNVTASVDYEITVDGNYAASASLPTPIPARQWIPIATTTLDPASSNLLTMTLTGSGSTNTYAAADVVKITPLVQPRDFIGNVTAEPGETTANIQWTTSVPTPSWVEYGEDLRYGGHSTTNAVPTTRHVMTLTGLTQDTRYQFQIDSILDGIQVTHQGEFVSLQHQDFTPSNTIPILPITNIWKYSTNNLDGVSWQSATYNDSSWMSGPGLLWIDLRTNGPNPNVQPKGQELPENPATHFPRITYYFRSHFTLGDAPTNTVLVFTNYIDDGAVFYLNGAEIYRNNMRPAPDVITNASLATAANCDGDATCPVVFHISGPLITNLANGDNVLAVEVHNYNAKSPDITFGSVLSYAAPPPFMPQLEILPSDSALTLYWNGDGFTLQQTAQLLSTNTPWADLPGPISNSPLTITNATRGFYRLRK